jgi:hypothetical protein
MIDTAAREIREPAEELKLPGVANRIDLEIDEAIEIWLYLPGWLHRP